jgi:hypothetical protein
MKKYEFAHWGKTLVLTEEDIINTASEPSECVPGSAEWEEALFYAIVEGKDSPFTATERDELGMYWDAYRHLVLEMNN